jgi:hypothetical protein
MLAAELGCHPGLAAVLWGQGFWGSPSLSLRLGRTDIFVQTQSHVASFLPLYWYKRGRKKKKLISFFFIFQNRNIEYLCEYF